jgi:hypothetical protein
VVGERPLHLLRGGVVVFDGVDLPHEAEFADVAIGDRQEVTVVVVERHVPLDLGHIVQRQPELPELVLGRGPDAVLDRREHASWCGGALA